MSPGACADELLQGLVEGIYIDGFLQAGVQTQVAYDGEGDCTAVAGADHHRDGIIEIADADEEVDSVDAWHILVGDDDVVGGGIFLKVG